MLFKLIIAKVIMEDFMVHRDIVLVSYLFLMVFSHWVFQVTLNIVYGENLSSVKINPRRK